MGFSFGMMGLLGRAGAAALLALMLSMTAMSAWAGVVLGGGSAQTGSEVKLRISGTTDLFFAADFTVRYDPALLTYVRVDAVSIPLTFTANTGAPNPTLVDTALTVNPDNVLAGLDYFDLVFLTSGPGGTTSVELLAGGFFAFQDPNDPIAPEIVETFSQNISATVNVRPNSVATVPVSSTLGLVLTGVALMALSRRRGGQPARTAAA